MIISGWLCSISLKASIPSRVTRTVYSKRISHNSSQIFFSSSTTNTTISLWIFESSAFTSSWGTVSSSSSAETCKLSDDNEGIITENSTYFPNSLLTLISPPSSSTSCLVRFKPIPLLTELPNFATSNILYLSNTSAICCSVNPLPELRINRCNVLSGSSCESMTLM